MWEGLEIHQTEIAVCPYSDWFCDSFYSFLKRNFFVHVIYIYIYIIIDNNF